MATAVLESQTIIVLDNTKQLPVRNKLQEEQAAAESSHDDVKVQGFRSSIVHKPGSSDSQTGGLTVQDPPKGWPFSEIHVNFNSLISENDPNIHTSIVTHRPEQSRIKQRQQLHLKHQGTNQHFVRQKQEQLHHEYRNLIPSQQQNLHQQHQQTYALLTNNNGFTQIANSNEFKQPPPYIITANGHQHTGLVSGNNDQSTPTVKESTEKIPNILHPNTGLHKGYSFGFVRPPNTSAPNNQKFNVIKQEFSVLGDDENKLLTSQQQHDDSKGIHIQSTDAHNTAPGNGEPNYVWHDVSPGLEISSNAPQLALGLHQNPAATQNPELTSVHVVNNNVGGQNQVAHLQVPNFDHANALGHSANFGYGDAMSPTPAQFYANQEHSVTVSQGHSGGVQEQEGQFQKSGHQIQNSFSVSETGRSSEKVGNVVIGTNKSPAVFGQPVNIPGSQHNQEQQQPGTQSVLPQANYAVDVTSNKAPLKLNTDLVQGIPGSLVLGSGLHLGYATSNAGQQNNLISTQDTVNGGGNGIPLQAFYIPLLGLQSGQLGNHQDQAVTLDGQHVEEVQQNLPGLVDSHMGKGINAVPLHYVGLPMINGYAGFGGLPVLQGNMIGIQGLHGVAGGTHKIGGMFLGGNYFSLPQGGLAFNNQNNLARAVYKPPLQSALQVSGQQRNTLQAQGNQYIQLPIGKNIISFKTTAPYQHQQVNNEVNQAVRPQINVHPNGFALKIQQQHPVPQQNFNLGGQQKFPLGGNRFPHQTSNFPAYEHVLGVSDTLKQDYRTFSFPPISAPHSQLPGFKLNHLSVTPLTQPPLNIQQEVPQSQTTVKRDENARKPPALSNLGTQFGDKNAHGWLNNYLDSKPGKPTSPFNNNFFPTNSPHVIGLRPPNYKS
jgi:hypothetical protein